MCNFCNTLNLFLRCAPTYLRVSESSVFQNRYKAGLVLQSIRKAPGFLNKKFTISTDDAVPEEPQNINDLTILDGQSTYGAFDLNFCPECGRTLSKEGNKNAETS